jgi:hypothetical protein
MQISTFEWWGVLVRHWMMIVLFPLFAEFFVCVAVVSMKALVSERCFQLLLLHNDLL